jgi:hypothetical protein
MLILYLNGLLQKGGIMEAMLVFIVLAGLYCGLKIFLERRLAPLDVLGAEGDLADVAFASGCSAYDLFQLAGQRWCFSPSKIEGDFKAYLNRGDIPGYVRLYIDAQPKQTRDRTYSKLIFSGGRPPYL